MYTHMCAWSVSTYTALDKQMRTHVQTRIWVSKWHIAEWLCNCIDHLKKVTMKIVNAAGGSQFPIGAPLVQWTSLKQITV